MEDTDKQVKGDSERTLIFTMILPPLDPLGGANMAEGNKGD